MRAVAGIVTLAIAVLLLFLANGVLAAQDIGSLSGR